MAYAEKTSVSVSRTKADIEELISRYGAEQFVSGFKGNTAAIGFTISGRQIRFILPCQINRQGNTGIHRGAVIAGRMMQRILHGNKRAGVGGGPCILLSKQSWRQWRLE